MPILASLIARLFELYVLLIVVWTFGSWFPQWRYQSWFRVVDSLVAPYVSLFHFLPLRTGQIDFTPMVAIFVIYIIRSAFMAVMLGGGHQ